MKQRVSLTNKVTIDLRARLRVDPKVVLSSRILQLQQQELEEAIEQELNDNPALERVESERESVDEKELVRSLARDSEWRTDDSENIFARSDVPESDWVECLAAPLSLHDHLVGQLLPMVDQEQQHIALLAIDSVNEKGYLDLPIEEIALLSQADIDDVVDVIRKLQKCDPPGVGASNLQECLELQLVGSDDYVDKLARAIVKRHWEDLLQKRTKTIARKYNLSDQDVESAFSRIGSLWPYPGEAFERTAGRGVKQSSGVSPDVIYVRTSSAIRIEIRGCDPFEFMINPWYRERFRALRSDVSLSDPDEKKHVKEFVGRAMNFIKGIHQRRRTMRKIAEHLLKEQYGFISTASYDFLKPLTRAKIANAAGVHESTVSRATMNKFVQIANGEIVPFDVFFRPALRVQKMIEEILLNENPSSPMSDREITELLNARGIHVARRTVNKYREQTRLLSSRRRKTA